MTKLTINIITLFTVLTLYVEFMSTNSKYSLLSIEIDGKAYTYEVKNDEIEQKTPEIEKWAIETYRKHKK